MNQKTIKAAMTPGEWSGSCMYETPNIFTNDNGEEMTHNSAYIKANGLIVADGKMICAKGKRQSFVHNNDEFLANTEAITTAINSTYNLGIDPTKVPKAFEYLASFAMLHEGTELAEAVTAFLESAKL